MSTNTGGPAFPCSVCNAIATIKQGNQHLCDMHYRFGQMRVKAKRCGKVVPTREALACMPGVDLVCPDCGRLMNWRAVEGQSSVASLQHYRDGSMSIVCRSCNTRHAYMEGDSYKEMPKDKKLCPSCGEVKYLSDFHKHNSRSGEAKRMSCCKSCSKIKTYEWRANNREKYNESRRKPLLPQKQNVAAN